MNYEEWPLKTPYISQLRLDPRNPRIPDVGRPMSQTELIAELVEHDRVYELAKRITDQGWQPIELPIAIEEDGSLIVCEGNRRIAALKCLLSPDAAPESAQKRFRRLAARAGSNCPNRIRLIVAPTRDDADVLIQSRHTSEQIARWQPAMQAKFYRDRIEKEGYTVDELANRFNVPASRIHDFLRNERLYRLACVAASDFPGEIADIVTNPREFKLTTLERVVDAEPGRHFLQLERDGDSYRVKAKQRDFLDAFRSLVRDVAKGELTSRTANDNNQLNGYLDRKLPGQRVHPAKRTFRVDALIDKAERKAETAEAPPEPPKPPRHKSSTPKSIVTRDVTCTVDNKRVKDVFAELKRLDIRSEKHLNATALVVRTLLELGLKHHLEQTNNWKQLLQDKGPRVKKAEWYPGLRDQLYFFLNKPDLLHELPPDGRAALKDFLDEQSQPSIRLLNFYAHNTQIMPNERALRDIWEMLKPLLQLILMRQDERS